MAKSLTQRVLEVSVRKGEFNLNVARKSFKNYFANSVLLDNSVMRRARELSNAGMLKRTGPGCYTPTKRGQNAVA